MRGERGALSIGWLFLIAATAGVGLGVGLGAGGADLIRDVRVLGANAVAFYDCPGGVGLGNFHRGDRVYATARNQGGGWVEVRSPNGTSARVWVEAQFTIADGPTDDLPVVDCGTEELALDATTTTTITLLEGITTTTAGAGGSDGAGGSAGGGGGAGGGGSGGGSAGGGSGGGGGATPGPTDTTPPTVGSISVVGASALQEVGLPTCPAQSFSIVSAPVNDDTGVASVTISWSVGTQSGSVTKSTGAGTYTHQVGNFPSSALPVGTSQAIVVTYTAKDAAGNTGTSTLNSFSTFRLVSCGTV